MNGAPSNIIFVTYKVSCAFASYLYCQARAQPETKVVEGSMPMIAQIVTQICLRTRLFGVLLRIEAQ